MIEFQSTTPTMKASIADMAKMTNCDRMENVFTWELSGNGRKWAMG